MKRHLLLFSCFVILTSSFIFSVPNTSAVRRIESVIVTPNQVIAGVPTTVRIFANVAPDPNLLVNSVNLIELGPNNRPIRIIGRLYDDGTHGDVAPSDNSFTIALNVNNAFTTVIKLQVSIAYKGTLQRILSNIFSISVSEKSFFIPPDPSKIVVDADGSMYPINHVIIILPPTSNRAIATTIAAEVGATIVGFSPSGNAYALEVSSKTIADLDTLIGLFEADSRIDSVFKNYIMGFNGVTNDLSILRSRDQRLTVAYDKIKMQAAWDLITNLNPPLAPVKIGILDSGVDKNHPEFVGVNFGTSPQDVFAPVNPHGTHVAGVIGASNLSAIGSIPLGSYQMNGILAGIPSSGNPAGSKIGYTLEVRFEGGLPPLFQSWTDIDDLAAVGAQVVNMSFGLQKPSFFDPSIVPSGVVSLPLFARVKAVYEHVMAAYPNIIFVAGAGNSGADVADFIPAGINLPNVIAVAATDLNDQRATFGTNASSNFGNLVAIAAPGKEVYAPKFFTSPLDADDYLFFSGTSAAAPMVTGVIGILKAIEGNLGLTPDQIKEILQQTGDPTDQTISGKRLNACKAVQRVLEMKNGLPPSFACPNSPPTITSITANPTAVHVGGQSTISIQASDPDGDPLVYLWVASCGTLSAQTGKEDKIWTAPAAVPSLGTCTVSVFVDDPAGSSGTTHENVFIDVTESPQVFYVTLLEGNPGIPGDGVIVSKIGGFIENFFELQPPFPLAGITNGITISAFPPSGVSLADSRLLSVMGRLLGQLDPCFFVVGGLDPKIITVNGVQGIAESISQELLNLTVNFGIRTLPGCENVTLDQFFLRDVVLFPLLNMELDALAVGLGENAFPTDTTPPEVTIAGRPAVVRRGSTSTISWTSSVADSCTVTDPNGVIAEGSCPGFACAGSSAETINHQSTFSIACENAGGSATASVTVRLVPVFGEF